MSGSASERVAAVTASARSLPVLILDRRDNVGEHDVHLPGEQIGKRRCLAAIWHVHYVDAGQCGETFEPRRSEANTCSSRCRQKLCRDAGKQRALVLTGA